MAELEKLLGFMSSWDRQATLDEYEAKFDAGGDPEAVMEALGSPTKVAVDLAKDYVSTPSPGETVSRDGPEIEVLSVSLEQLLAEEDAALAGETAEPSPAAEEAAGTAISEPPEAPTAPDAKEPPAAPAPVPDAGETAQTRQGAGIGVLALYWVLAAVIGIPVALALFCVGVPFLAGGVAVIVAALTTIPGAFASYALLSDVLLLAGALFALLAAGLLLAWFGLWLGLSLARLWSFRLALPLGRRLRYGKAARPARARIVDVDLMAQLWKYVGIAVVILLACGMLLGGAGLLTGAEPSRVWRYLEQDGHLDAIRNAVSTARNTVASIF